MSETALSATSDESVIVPRRWEPWQWVVLGFDSLVPRSLILAFLGAPHAVDEVSASHLDDGFSGASPGRAAIEVPTTGGP
jgi:hypothetical protein